MSDSAIDVIQNDSGDACPSTLEFPVVDRDTAESAAAWAEQLHQFANDVAAACTAKFHQLVECSLLNLRDRVVSDDYDARGCTWQIRIAALPDPIYLHLDARALFSTIECSLGGSGTSDIPLRSMTNIEERVASVSTKDFAEVWCRLWGLGDADAVTSVDKLQHLPATSPNDAVSNFSLNVNGACGRMDVVVSQRTREALLCGVKTTSSLHDSGVKMTATSRNIAARLDRSKATVVVNLAETTVRTSELLGLQPGDVITTDTTVEDLLQVRVEGTVKFSAAAGAYRGQKAIRVTGIAETKTA